jgi:hypothetical protein
MMILFGLHPASDESLNGSMRWWPQRLELAFEPTDWKILREIGIKDNVKCGKLEWTFKEGIALIAVKKSCEHYALFSRSAQGTYANCVQCSM